VRVVVRVFEKKRKRKEKKQSAIGSLRRLFSRIENEGNKGGKVGLAANLSIATTLWFIVSRGVCGVDGWR